MSAAELPAVIERHTGNARRVLQYAQITKTAVDAAKQPGFARDGWNPLRDLISTDVFVRVGNFKEVMNWDEYVTFLTNWAPNADWDCSFKRVTEVGNLVFLELEEFSVVGQFSSAVNSVSVYEFDEAGLITRIDVYLQMALPSPELLQGYDGVQVSGQVSEAAS